MTWVQSSGYVRAFRWKAWCELTIHHLQPEMGVDAKNRVVTAIGSLDNTVTFNSVLDVASTIVRLSIMAAADRNSVPDRVRINGDAKSYNEVANILRQELGVDIAVKSIDPEEYNKVAESSLFKDLR